MNNLYRIGGAAALLAGILLRRNLGVEIALFGPQPPDTAAGWYALLQSNRLLALAYLNIFDIANYALVALMLLALYAALRADSPSSMAVALSLGLLGVGVYFAANTALSLLALSHQYAAAADGAQKAALLAGGEALLALNRFSSAGAQPGSGGYLSLFLLAAAGLIISLVMLRGAVFGKATAWIGIAAAALDLAYCVAFPFAPAAAAALLAVLFIPAAGLLLMIWHILLGWRLLRLGRTDFERRSSL